MRKSYKKILHLLDSLIYLSQISKQISNTTSKKRNISYLHTKQITDMTEIDNISIRISNLVDYFAEGKNTKLAKLLNTSEANIRNYRRGRMPKIDFIYKACVKLEISFEWLLFGKGKMLETKSEQENREDYRFALEKEADTSNKIDSQTIPIYNLKADNELLHLLNNPNKFKPADYISLPNIGKVDGGLYAVGDSMKPLIKHGDIIIFRQINDLPNSIFWGEMYLISYNLENEEYIVIKYIQKSDVPGCIRLASQNQHHSPKDIPITNIKALAQIKASIRFNTVHI